MTTADTSSTILRRPPSDLIGGCWRALAPVRGDESPHLVVSRNPARPREIVWSGTPNTAHVADAVAAARAALPKWAALGREKRFAVLRRFQQICKAREGAMARLLGDEVGKVPWEARGEASILASKVDITLEDSEISGLRRVREFEFAISPPPPPPPPSPTGADANQSGAGETEQRASAGLGLGGGGRGGRCMWRPHGVMAVLGPFNFPAHLPNGHIVPALAMGNTIVFKPSDKAPAVGQLLVEFFDEALREEGVEHAGVINLVQGGAEIASSLVAHSEIDGILFTGSWGVGRRIMHANLDTPGRIVALELGGNNGVVVMPDADLRQAAVEIVRSAFNTTGQRCTCTRRVIVHRETAGKLMPLLCKTASNLVIGDPRSADGTPVFMGPIINAAARDAVLAAQSEFSRGGGRVLLESTSPENSDGGWYITPGIVEVERFVANDGGRPDAGGLVVRDPGCDIEVFGPLLRVCVVDSLDDAMEQVNATRYGLAASIFTRDETAAERFLYEARAGCVNINTGTAGASSRLPFGGLGLSGNHRPAGSFALDYCAYPVAGMIERGAVATLAEGMRFDESWL